MGHVESRRGLAGSSVSARGGRGGGGAPLYLRLRVWERLALAGEEPPGAPGCGLSGNMGRGRSRLPPLRGARQSPRPLGWADARKRLFCLRAAGVFSRSHLA
jgi:hypothetical protein